MQQFDLTPTERLMTLSLQLNPGQTDAELKQSIGTKSKTQFAVARRTLTIANIIIKDAEGRWFLANA
jgi:hypothetical protein